MDEIGIAVVGYGVGAYHCEQIKKVPGLRLQGVCEVDPAHRAEAKAAYSVKTYASLEEVLGDAAVELVVLATPHDTHAPMALEVLAAGRHVVVEKVMCLNLKEADEMIEASCKAGRTLTVHQNRRLDADYLTTRQVMSSGVLGDVYRVEAASNFWGPHIGWRRVASAGGGYIYDAGAHVIDQLVLLTGCRARTVFADLQRRVWTDTMDTETCAHITIRFENDLVGVVDISGIAWHKKPRWLLLGEKGSFIKEDWSEGPGYIRTQVADLPAKIEVESAKDDWIDFYRRLADHLLKGSELAVKPEEVRESIKIIEGAFRSDQEGRSVEVLDW